ncbi:XrtA-associated tyrosine autokinase [Methylomarinum vadi]|uniref:XrtA-associated tyrosine autokinase n=1 Tax=Methylomarinum vadi TaxID=438855 RepID=UPI0004DF3DD2|nr:XrtA-associated tyrosine autokinase [Methylomarinum vadi]
MSTIEEALRKAEQQKQIGQKIIASDDSASEPHDIQQDSHDSIEGFVANDQESFNRPVEKFDWNFLKSKGYICPESAHSKLAEEYRSIKRPLVVNAIGARKKDIQRSNLILITSSVPGEGKTFTSINLALSISAEFDKKVLLIDADVSKPAVSKVLKIKQTPGLIEYLEGEVDNLSDIILHTEIDGLRIIPAGKRHKYSTELLASNKMVSLAKELSERYADRIVIFDTPPLLATTQAEVLASMVGQVVLVIAADSTSQSLVMESVKKLENCADVVLTLLNKTKRSLDTSYYGYGKY